MTGLLLSLALAMGPTVSVKTEAGSSAEDSEEAAALRRWLVPKLLEEGFAVAPGPGGAEVSVILATEDGDIAVETAGERHRIEPGPRAVVRLEVLHRARRAAEAAPLVVAPPPSPSVAIVTEGALPEEASGALAVELLDAGYLLRPDPDDADALVCARMQASTLQTQVGLVQSGCGGPVFSIAHTSLSDAERFAPVISAVDALLAPSVETPVPDAPGSVVLTHGEVRRGGWLADSEAEVRLSGAGGVMIRGAADGGVWAGARVGMAPGPGGRLSLGVMPWKGRGLEVVDVLLSVGPDIALDVGKRGRFETGVVVGALIHSFRSDERTSGGTVDWYAGLPVSFSWRIFGRARIHLLVEGGLAGDPLKHDGRSGTLRWERTAWSIRGALGFSYGWRIH